MLDIHEIASFADYFVICSGTSDRMLDSLSDTVSETAKGKYDLAVKVEGDSREGWVLVDMGDVVVHLFSPDRRDYYRLEQLWERGKILVRLQ